MWTEHETPKCGDLSHLLHNQRVEPERAQTLARGYETRHWSKSPLKI